MTWCPVCAAPMPSSSAASCSECGADWVGPDPFLGATIDGKFLLRRSLAQGGMGRVYEGLHVPLGKTIAVKLLHQHLVRDDAMRNGFRNEARAAAALTHPNTVAVLDYGVTGSGVPYLVTDLVRGTGLDEAITREGRLAPSRARAITLQICDVLGALHERHILHRDIKPANLRLLPLRDGGELVKVLDFGLAKILDPWAVPSAQSSTAGMLVGTPAYMAPEQVQGRPLDGRTDLYALTLVLYEMLTGVRPFDAPSPVESAALHLVFQPPPPAEFNPHLGLPPAIDAVIQRGLEQSPERRFATARELRDAVAAALPASGEAPLDGPPWLASRTPSGAALAWSPPSHEAPLASPPPARARRRWLHAAFGALALGGGLLGWSFFDERGASSGGGADDRAAGGQRLPVALPVPSAGAKACLVPAVDGGMASRAEELLSRARTLEEDGLLDDALGGYLDVILLEPANAAAYEKAGLVSVELDRAEDARMYLEAYLRLAPAAVDAAAMQSMIESL